MLTIKHEEYTEDHYFAALKLLEQLCWDGKLEADAFRSILNKYADTVDLSQFSIPEAAETGKEETHAEL